MVVVVGLTSDGEKITTAAVTIPIIPTPKMVNSDKQATQTIFFGQRLSFL